MIKNLITIIIAISIANLFFSCKKEDGIKPDNLGNSINGKTSAVFNPKLTYGTMTDQDGNVYKTIVIGTQTWMAENLRTTKYRNGETIPEAIAAWNRLSTGAYCNFNNTKNNDTIATYGRLYNWFSVSDSRNLAPSGWHVPTNAEWTILETYLGGPGIAGEKMKEIGITHWTSPNVGADNSSGFTALPGSYRECAGGSFYKMGASGNWWCNTTYNSITAWTLALGNSISYSCHLQQSMLTGYSVRCIRDN